MVCETWMGNRVRVLMVDEEKQTAVVMFNEGTADECRVLDYPIGNLRHPDGVAGIVAGMVVDQGD